MWTLAPKARSDHQGVGVSLSPDAEILRRARRESVRTSPEAFITTLADVDAMPATYWERELRLAKWTVAEGPKGVVGVAGAKLPCPDDESYVTNPAEACFIESVWIDPSMRQRGYGERLVQYLIGVQREAGFSEFYLWVLNNNRPAIDLYERLQFKETGRDQVLGENVSRISEREIQYVLRFDSKHMGVDERARYAAIGKKRRLRRGVSYRLLG
jgi:N-acetylglutamate synthase-like GNAT family acetyltransferase